MTTDVAVEAKLLINPCGGGLDNCLRGPVERAKQKHRSLLRYTTGPSATTGESTDFISEMLMMVREMLRGWWAGRPLKFEERFGLVASAKEGALFGRAL